MLILIYLFDAIFSGHPWGGGGEGEGDPRERHGNPMANFALWLSQIPWHLRARFHDERKYPLTWGNNNIGSNELKGTADITIHNTTT